MEYDNINVTKNRVDGIRTIFSGFATISLVIFKYCMQLLVIERNVDILLPYYVSG